jgi:hypothetical protein
MPWGRLISNKASQILGVLSWFLSIIATSLSKLDYAVADNTLMPDLLYIVIGRTSGLPRRLTARGWTESINVI